MTVWIWTTRYGDTTRVLAASTIGCKEWVVARPGPGAPVAALAGDGRVLAYALRGGPWDSFEDESDDWYGEVLSRSAVQVTAISSTATRSRRCIGTERSRS